MIKRKWLILCPLAMEAKAVAAELGELGTIQTIGIRGRRLDRGVLGQYEKVMLAGLAGALDPSLQIGDIVFSSPSPGMLPEGWGEGLHIREGLIHVSERIITNPDEKKALFETTGCVAVDMESDIVVAANVPFLHIRAISDTASDALPANISDWVDDLGNPRLSRVTGELALHPRQIPAMIRLGKNSKLAAGNLARAVRQIVQQG